MTAEELAVEVSEAVLRAGAVSKSVLAYAISRRKVFHLNVDVKGPCVVVPEHGCVHKYVFLKWIRFIHGLSLRCSIFFFGKKSKKICRNLF